ncbi:hypothetical protein G6O69_31710 [Pseudenhygromyxa sp. WMMC2535]|uniref:hypothetical protein n=1 Tax=Pseudenhygromyxa sp. WMMC2535 TaxID=2712867 RepID=UPI001555C2A3|nr:hypothetical protein [Pseudenhygromyxa sp. WMMC2535]NVB42433.1 hypothetical protein [Pseudenhygromyxa sp. WMMC2535]
MPTHQGQTQTDITLAGSRGSSDSIVEGTSFDFSATHALSGALQVEDLAAGTDRQYTAYELVVRDPTGATLATLAARYKAWVDRGSAEGAKDVAIDSDYDPAAAGSSPSWPISAATVAERSWKVETFDDVGNLFATAHASWQVRSTVQAGARVIQTVVDQSDALLRVHLVYLDGDVVLLDMVVSMTGGVSVAGSISADPADVSDRFTP